LKKVFLAGPIDRPSHPVCSLTPSTSMPNWPVRPQLPPAPTSPESFAANYQRRLSSRSGMEIMMSGAVLRAARHWSLVVCGVGSTTRVSSTVKVWVM
jgi:hypothetical protein